MRKSQVGSLIKPKPSDRWKSSWADFWALIQGIYGVLFLTVRFLDPLSFTNLPGVIAGAPFLLVAWGLWKRARWSLWLGLVHSALLPLTMIFVCVTMGHRRGDYGPHAAIGEMLLFLCVTPLWMINILVFLTLLLKPSARRRFEPSPFLVRPQWSLRSMLVACLLLSIMLSDYPIQRQRISQEGGTRAERERIAASMVDGFVRSVESSDSPAVVKGRAEILEYVSVRHRGGYISQGGMVVQALAAQLTHPDERVQLEVIDLLITQDQHPVYPLLVQDALEHEKETGAVRDSLLEFLAKATLAGSYIHVMQNPQESESARREAAQRLLGLSWAWERSDEGCRVKLCYLKELLLVNDTTGSNTLPYLIALLDGSTHWGNRLCALRTLALWSDLDPRYEEPVRNCLADESWLVRTQAAALLVHWQHDDERLVQVLTEAVNQPYSYYSTGAITDARITAIEALDRLGPKAQSAIPELTTAANDANRDIRTTAQAALNSVTTSTVP
jgi:hypothetical protein